MERSVVGLASSRAHRDASSCACIPVVDKDIRLAICVPVHQITSLRSKGHIAPMLRDGWPERTASGTLATIGGHRHAGRLVRGSVVDENVRRAIGVAEHQVAGQRLKGHIVSVGRDGWHLRPALALRAIGGHRDAHRLAGLLVVDKDINRVVGITEHQIVGPGLEGDVAPVGRDGRVQAGDVPLCSIRGHRDAGGLAGQQVVDKNIAGIVGVIRHQVVGIRIKGHIAPIVRDRGPSRTLIPLGAF